MERINASLSTDGASTFVSVSQRKILKLMKMKNTMIVRTHDYRGNPTQIGKFPLNGFTTAYNKACDWWEKEKEKEGREKKATIEKAERKRKVIMEKYEITLKNWIAYISKNNYHKISYKELKFVTDKYSLEVIE